MRLRVLTANIAMGNPRADHPLENLYGLTMFHNWRVIPFVLFGNKLRFLFNYMLKPNKKRVPYFSRVSDLSKTLEMIREERPDLLVVNELFVQFHRDILTTALRGLGFRHFAWGLAAHHPDATLVTLVASRLPIIEGDAPLVVPQSKEVGGGGGAECLRLQDAPITIVGCHLANGIKHLLVDQMKAITDFASSEQSRGRQVIIAGDFNSSEKFIQGTAGFANLRLKGSTDRPTCPLGVPKIFQGALDHVFIPGSWRVLANKFPAFGSDHLAVSVEVESA